MFNRDNEKLIKSSNNLNDSEISELRERFITEYSKKKGWNKKSLTPNQMLEIVEQREYKYPGIIKG